MKLNEQLKCFEIKEDVLSRWQGIVDIMAELIDIPAALIMRLVEDDIEVFAASQTPENPYSKGDHDHFLGSGLYCETVINTNRKLLVPNALKDDKWNHNPDIKLNMISYLGFPIYFPNGEPFGTICVLDRKENHYSETYECLIENFRQVIQSQLELIYMNQTLGEENKNLSDYISEIKTLRGIIPICSSCKKVRDSKGYWIQVEKYIQERTDASFSHGVCETCAEKLYGDQSWYKDAKKEIHDHS